MEKAYYWLGRKRAYLKAARAATSSEARLIHSELARRYNVNAFTRATSAIDLEGSLPRSISRVRSHTKNGAGL